MINIVNLKKMIAEKYISVQKHPKYELFIYNYTQKAQFDRVWNNETMQCRGLIADASMNIVARPFPKFFNLQEAINQGEVIPTDEFIVTEKMDGSLGILYWVENKPYIATRGSFISDQSVKANEILRKKYAHLKLNQDWTALFEIIYPENRIVVDYGQTEDLVLLSIVDTYSSLELPYKQIKAIAEIWGMPVVKKYDGITDFTKIEQRPNSEGYVITFVTGQRYKIKFEEYVRLHRLVTGVNARRIWDLLRNDQPFDELLERVPDEFFEWVKRTRGDLQYEYLVIESCASKLFESVRKLPTRKEQALKIIDSKTSYSGVVFAMLNEKPYEQIIWKMLKPKHETPFKKEI